MSLSDLGNIGEFVGAIGVVVSFVFLAVQVRNNTNAIRDAAAKDMAEHTAEFLAPIVADGDVARIFHTGLRDWFELSEIERLRFSMLMFGAFYYFQNVYSLHRRHRIDPEYWDSQWQVMRFYASHAGFREWWKRARANLNRSFVAFMEAEAFSGEG